MVGIPIATTDKSLTPYRYKCGIQVEAGECLRGPLHMRLQFLMLLTVSLQPPPLRVPVRERARARQGQRRRQVDNQWFFDARRISSFEFHKASRLLGQRELAGRNLASQQVLNQQTSSQGTNTIKHSRSTMPTRAVCLAAHKKTDLVRVAALVDDTQRVLLVAGLLVERKLVLRLSCARTRATNDTENESHDTRTDRPGANRQRAERRTVGGLVHAEPLARAVHGARKQLLQVSQICGRHKTAPAMSTSGLSILNRD